MEIPGFKRNDIKTSGARIVTVVGGSGPPVLLMHGNPFNHLSWLKVAPALAKEFTVVCTDLRGYGDSEKPPGGDDHAGYSFRAMAQDQVEVMNSLGFRTFAAAGHDRGARVLHRMCLDHPQKLKRAAIVDIIPQHYLYAHINKSWATFSWHWFFNIQPEPLPEKMMGADPDWFIQKKLAKTAQGCRFFVTQDLKIECPLHTADGIWGGFEGAGGLGGLFEYASPLPFGTESQGEVAPVQPDREHQGIFRAKDLTGPLTMVHGLLRRRPAPRVRCVQSGKCDTGSGIQPRQRTRRPPG